MDWIEEQIKTGDNVKVWRIHDQTGKLVSYKATVIHIPQGEGDSWHLKREDGSIEVLNIYSKLFDSIVKEIK